MKNRGDPTDPAVRADCGRLSGWVGIICNMLLFAGKMLIGTISGSVSITADAVNNLSDASGSIITLVGFRLAAKPADAEHPYGHNRMEYLAGLSVAVLILVIGVELIKSSFQKILHPAAVEFSAAVVIVLLLSIVIKLLMAAFNRKLGKYIRSAALEAAAADSRNDVISTAAVLLACIIGRLSGVMLDGYIGLLVALFILWSGIGIVRDTIDPLLGQAPDAELVRTLAETITAHAQILGIHDLMVHDYGPGRRFASVHAEMDAKTDVLEAHELIDDIEHEVKTKLNVELVIHFDPIVTDDEELTALRERVLAVITQIDDRLSIHDFRLVRGSRHSNVIFDLVTPPELQSSSAELQKKIESAICSDAHRYHTVITFDCEAFNNVQKEPPIR